MCISAQICVPSIGHGYTRASHTDTYKKKGRD